MATVDDAAEGIRTNNDGRQALGIAAGWVQRGYTAIDNIDAPGVILDYVGAYADLKDRGKSLLDDANGYAVQIYSALPSNDEPLGTNPSKAQVIVALKRVYDAMKALEAASRDLAVDYVDDLMALGAWYKRMGQKAVDLVTKDIPEAIGKGVGNILTGLWPLLVVVGVVLLLIWKFGGST